MSASRSLLFAALLAVTWLPFQAAAQSTEAGSTELRGSGGQIDVRGRTSARWSGSLGISTSQSDGALTGGSARGLEATLGGAVVADRLWFFGSAQLTQSSLASRFGALPVQAVGPGNSQAFDAKATAQLGDRQMLVSSFATGLDGMANPAIGGLAPESFFSMHYTGIVSANMFFTASATRSSGTRSLLSLQPLR